MTAVEAVPCDTAHVDIATEMKFRFTSGRGLHCLSLVLAGFWRVCLSYSQPGCENCILRTIPNKLITDL